MGMPAQHTEWTAGMARALPDDGKRYEVLDGKLFVSPAPSFTHQRAVALLYEILAPYARTHGIGETMVSPADIEFSATRLVQPDIFVIPVVPGRPTRAWRDITRLLLAAEVLSPSTARGDRYTKRIVFQDEGVPDYWIVDLDARVFERWRPSDQRPEILGEVLHWQPAAATAPLTIDLVRYFADVWR